MFVDYIHDFHLRCSAPLTTLAIYQLIARASLLLVIQNGDYFVVWLEVEEVYSLCIVKIIF